MKNYDKLSRIIMAIGLLVAFSNIAIIILVLLNMFSMDTVNIVIGNYIGGICMFAIISLIQLFASRCWVRVSEVSARLALDLLPRKKMVIEAELKAGTMTQEYADSKECELQKDTSFFHSIVGCSKLFSNIGKIITISLMCILILLFTFVKLKIITIEQKYLIAILIDGVLSQLILIFTACFTLWFTALYVWKKANNDIR